MENSNLKVLLVGNPNCGKSTIFNSLSGGGAHVGNYSGVTVERKVGHFDFEGAHVELEDLPGLYSLSPSSKEESVVRDVVGAGEFDLIANVIDSSNLERNLFLTIQLTEMHLPMVVVLNMTDELESDGKSIDVDTLSSILNVPVIKSVGYKNSSACELKKFLIESSQKKIEPKFLWQDFRNQAPYDDISNLSHLIKENLPDSAKDWSRWFAIQAVEGDRQLLKNLSEKSPEILTEAESTIQKIRTEFDAEPAGLIAAARFSIARRISSKVLKKTGDVKKRVNVDKMLDKVFLNRYLGLPIFFALMYLCFQFVFTLGDPIMGFMEDMFASLAEFISDSWQGESAMKSLVIDGVIGGVGGVLVFLPNIVLLFLALALLEDSGYMARAAFLCDRMMRRFGLSGSSLIPMLVGFGCSVPGIMATRSLKNKAERLATIAVLPLFSCGARFTAFMLLIPAFFAVEYRASALFGIYLFGVILALVAAKVLRVFSFKGGESTFILELPPYRLPRVKNMLLQVWERAFAFIKKAGTLVLGISIILWFMANYPEKTELSKDYDAQVAALQANASLNDETKATQITDLENEKQAEMFEYTISGRIGSALEPVLRPIGFDKRVSSALIGALAAKEVFISQLGIVYGMGEVDAEEGSETLRDRLGKDYSFWQGLSIILFLLISMPCVATISTTYAETKSVKMALGQAFGLTLLAYLVSFAVYHLGMIL